MNTNSKAYKLSIAVIILLIIILSIFAIKKSNNPSAPELTASEVYTKLKGSIYPVSNWDDKGQIIEFGSAVAVTDKFLATNCHVVGGGNYFTLYVNNIEQRGYVYAQHNDVCIIGVKKITFTPVNIRLSSTVEIGEKVYSLGNPEGLDKTFSEGIISNKYDDAGLIYLQTDAAMAPGSSGGGLFDKDGNLIGLTTKANPSERIGFVYSTELIKAGLLDPEIEIPANTSNKESVETDQTSDKDMDKVPHNTESPQQIKSFGNDNNVTLNSDKGNCFIAINGKSDKGVLAGIAIWFPDTPGAIFLFPDAANLDDVVSGLEQLKAKSTVKKSKSSVVFDGAIYPLADTFNGKDKAPFLVFAIKLNLTDKLSTAGNFTAKFYNDADANVTTASFGLNGFPQALDALHATCN